MTIRNTLGGKCKCCAFATIIMLALCLFSQLVISSYYFNKTNPWFLHGTTGATLSCMASIVTVVFSILSLGIILIILITYCCCKSCSKSKCCCILTTIFLILFTAVAIITGVITSITGLANPSNENDGDGENIFGQCYDYYISDISFSIREYAINNDKVDSFIDWIIDFLYLIVDFNDKKVDKEEYKKNDINMIGWKTAVATDTIEAAIATFVTLYGDGKLNSSMCIKYAVPELLFSLITVVLLIIYMANLCCGCCCGKNNDDSDQEMQSRETNL